MTFEEIKFISYLYFKKHKIFIKRFHKAFSKKNFRKSFEKGAKALGEIVLID